MRLCLWLWGHHIELDVGRDTNDDDDTPEDRGEVGSLRLGGAHPDGRHLGFHTPALADY